MFRRSGSFATFLVHGVVPAPGSTEFCEALSSHRFQSIETAASEQQSIGWVTPTDPTGESFERDDMDHDATWWLRIRIDVKKLPPAWLKIYATSAERSRGRPLSRKERKELRDDLERKLLPKVLPTVKLVDALYVPDHQRVHLFATGVGVRDAFSKLFHATFDAELLTAEPRVLAQSLGMGRDQMAYLDEVSPVRWPRAGAAPQLSLVNDEPDVADAPRMADEHEPTAPADDREMSIAVDEPEFTDPGDEPKVTEATEEEAP